MDIKIPLPRVCSNFSFFLAYIRKVKYLTGARDKTLCGTRVGVSSGFGHVASLFDVEKENPAHHMNERAFMARRVPF